MDRFCKILSLVSSDRLTVENDDKASMYSVKELWRGYKRIKTCVVFVYHRFCDGVNILRGFGRLCQLAESDSAVVHYSFRQRMTRLNHRPF